MKTTIAKILSVACVVLGAVFMFQQQAQANLADIFEECQPHDAKFNYTCLAPTDCAAATAGTQGGATADQCSPTANPGEFLGVCCKVVRPNSAVSYCEAFNGSCKPSCDSSVESDMGATDCGGGNTCCAAKTSTVSQACAAQGGVCKQSCAGGDFYIGALQCPSSYICCKPATLVTPSSATTSAATTGGDKTQTVQQVNSPDRLVLPSCTKDGSCQLDDIVQTGINFATFIMGLSGALFFAVFIYGGAMYLASFGSKSRVEKGKSAIKGAVIGMVFVLGAWTIVNTLNQGLRYGKSPGDNAPTTQGTLKPEEKCPAQGPEYSCVTLNGKTAQEAKSDGDTKGYSCLTGLCPGAANILCCKQK